jgi:archaellum biogenesis ATPase FlaH
MLDQKYVQELEKITTETEVSELIPLGFQGIDSLMGGGLRKGCCYLFSGSEKSGKSAYLFNVINNCLNNTVPVGLVSTEMVFRDVISRMRGIAHPHSETEAWRTDLNLLFSFVGPEDITVDNKFSFTKIMQSLETMVANKVQLVIIDNFTSLGAEAASYSILGGYVSQLFTRVKKLKIAVIFVIHVRQDVVFKETPDGVRNLIKSGKPEDILTESVTVMSRPTLKDVFGGGQALSQLTGGALFLWRPFQKFDVVRLRSIGLILVDSHRYGPSGQIPVMYNESIGKFLEITNATPAETEQLGLS